MKIALMVVLRTVLALPPFGGGRGRQEKGLSKEHRQACLRQVLVNIGLTCFAAALLLLHIPSYKKLPSHPRKVSAHSASPKAELTQQKKPETSPRDQISHVPSVLLSVCFLDYQPHNKSPMVDFKRHTEGTKERVKYHLPEQHIWII